jgi:putative two-component system response regulator
MYASPMHDIGKIGIPDHILLKTDKLNQDEWEIMKQHTVIGGKILEKSPIDFIQLGEIIALTHHEKWDGSGYPQGLAGTQISMAGRITAIADAFDAIGSQRPYKKALPVEKSLEIIKNSRGTHFDPDAVDAFFIIKDEILSIKEQHKDEYEFGASLKKELPFLQALAN